MVVHPALDYGIDFDWAESGVFGGGYARQNALRPEPAPVHAFEDVVVQRIQAYRDSPQSRVLEPLGELRQKVGVGRHGQVFDAVYLGEHGDERVHLRPDERLAARDSRLRDAETRHDADDSRHFLESQQRLARQELVALAVYLRRHAVGAAEVAPVRHRNPQIAQRAAEAVE